MKINLKNIEWIIYKNAKTSNKVEDFVAYYILEDEDGCEKQIFVIAKGYGGGGVNEMCEAVANFSKCGKIESYKIFDLYSEDVVENSEIFSQIWDFMYDNYIEVDCDDFMTYKGSFKQKTKIIQSDDFQSDDFLEEISENWGLYLTYRC